MGRRWKLFLFGFALCLLIVTSCSTVLSGALQGADGGVAQADSSLQAMGAGAAENFTVVVLPDTQFYSESYPGIFDNQTQWIVE